MSKVTIPTVAISITRDAMTILPAVVPAHELPVVQAVFGEDNVEQVREAGEVELDAAIEAERLVSKYGQGALESAFGTNFKTAIAKAIGEAAAPAKAATSAKKG